MKTDDHQANSCQMLSVFYYTLVL